MRRTAAFTNSRVEHSWSVLTHRHGLETLMLCFIFSLPWHAPRPRCISLSITPPFAMVFEIALLERSSCHPLAFQDGIKSCRPSGRSCQILLVSSHASGSQPTTDICDGSRPLMVSLLHQQGRSTKKLIVWPPPRPNAIMMHFDTQPTSSGASGQRCGLARPSSDLSQLISDGVGSRS